MSSRYYKRDAEGKPYELVMSLAEIGRELGISHERVRQLEARALAKAKAILERRGYTLQDLLPEVDHHD